MLRKVSILTFTFCIVTDVKTFTSLTIAQSLHVACVISIGSPSWFKTEIFPVLRSNRKPVADWPSGAPGVFLMGRCTMWAGPLLCVIYIKKWIVVNVCISSAQTNGLGRAAHFIQKI